MQKSPYILYVPLVSFLVFWTLGLVGFTNLYETQPDITFLDNAYRSLQLFTIEGPKSIAQMPLSIEIARFGAAFTTVMSIVGGFLLTSHKLISKFLLRFWRNHIVVAGLNDVSVQFILDTANRGKKVVVIVKDIENCLISLLEKRGVICIEGRIGVDDQLCLQEARISTCSKFFAFFETDNENVEALFAVSQYMNKYEIANSSSESVIHIFVRFQNSAFQNSLEKHSISDAIPNKIYTSFFNLRELIARNILNEFPLEVNSSGGVEDEPELIILGNSHQGIAILHQALKLGHYKHKGKLPITILSDDKNKTESLLSRNISGIHEIAKLSIQEISNSTPEAYISALEELTEQTQSTWKSIICSTNDEARNFALANELVKNRNLFKGRVFCVLPSSKGLALALNDRSSEYELIPLPQEQDLSSWANVVDEDAEYIAKRIHERYVRKRLEEGKSVDQEPALRVWEHLHESFKEQNRAQADHALIKLRMIGLNPKSLPPRQELTDLLTLHLEDLAEIEHSRWNATKYLEGWRYGAEKNTELLRHPCLVSWSELSEEIKGYDRETVLNIPNLFYD